MGKVKYVDIPKGLTFRNVLANGNDWVMLLLQTDEYAEVKKFVKLPETAKYVSVTQQYDDKIGVIYTDESASDTI